MKRSTPMCLLAAVCALGAVLWLADSRPGGPRGRADRSTRLLPVKTEDITGLTVERGGNRLECVKRGPSWFVQAPLDARADEGQMDRILGVIESLTGWETITAEQRQQRQLTLADYGLEAPAARVSVRAPLVYREILVGRRAPLGNGVYVKLASKDDVVLVPDALLDVLPDRVEALRDRRIFHGEVDRITRIEIRRPNGGFIRMSRAGGDWMIQQPIAVPADGARVTQMLDALRDAVVVEFVWDPPVSAAPAAAPGQVAVTPEAPVQSYGLAPDEAGARIEVWLSGDAVGQELTLGKPVGEQGKEVYAKLRDWGSVYAVNRRILDAFSVTLNDIRSRGVFLMKPADVRYAVFQEGDRKLVLNKQKNTWMLLEPFRWKADDEVVEGVLLQLAGLNVTHFLDATATNAVGDAFAEPAFTVLLADQQPVRGAVGVGPVAAATAPAADPGCGRLIVGRYAADGTSRVFAKFDNEDTLMELSVAQINGLNLRPSEPLQYRDRTLLALGEQNVRRIHVQFEGGEHSVIRGENDRWVAEKPAGGEVDARAVADLLRFACRMRASRIESQDPPDLVPFGLDRPLRTLTLGLTGEEGIQKSVLFGAPAGQDGIYGMVQGQDVVFVLDRNVAALLCRDFMKPLKPPPAAVPEGGNAKLE